ncbi:MAG: glycoside hydrolase family 127 protein [Ginsengibacter sp.]
MDKSKEYNPGDVSRRKFISNTALSAAGLFFVPNFLNGSNLTQESSNGIPEHFVENRLTEARFALISGYIGEKLDQSYKNRILAQNIDELIEPFKHRTETHLWQTEFWGKWFTSAVLAYRYRPEPELKKTLDTAVSKLLETQTEDGYIGNYKEQNHLEQWDIWGRKYCMLGLLDYYDLTGDKKILNAVVKLADHLIKEINEKDGLIVNKGNYRGMAASSILGAIVRLYSATGMKKYLSFAEEIVRQWETPEGPQLISKSNVDVSKRFPKPKNWYSWEQGQKAYEMMSCYEGLIELYKVTGKEIYKTAAESTWENINHNEINIAGSGASEEMWFGGKQLQGQPVKHFQETCVTVTWLRFSHQLLRLTGDMKYANAIEQSFYNALISAINADGSDWAKYTPLNGKRLPGSGQCGMKLNCCVASGPRGLFSIPLTAVMQSKNGICINFYVNGEYHLSSPDGKEVKVIQETFYPASGNVTIHLETESPEELAIRLRIPDWSKKSMVKVNNDQINNVTAGNYVEIKRRWASNDKITIQFDMRGRLESIQNCEKYAAVLAGPIVLARDTRFESTDLGTVNSPVKNEEGYVVLNRQQPEDGSLLQFKVAFLPESYREYGPSPIQITMCDYASAGNGKTKSTYQVWMPQLLSLSS